MTKGTVNRVILIGYVGQEPKFSKTEKTSICSLSLATTDSYGSKSLGTYTEETDWHYVNFFGRLAEVVNEYVHKGDRLYIEGKYKHKKYTDKQGIEKLSSQVIADSMQIIGNKNKPVDAVPDGNRLPILTDYEEIPF